MEQNALVSNLLLSGNIVLLLLGGLQGLLLCLLLWRKKAGREGYGWLMAYLLVLMAQLTFKILDKWWMMQNLHSAYQISYLFPFLYGPLVWLFTKRFAGDSGRFRPLHLLHFLPFLLSWVVVLGVYTYPLAGVLFRALHSWSGLAVQIALLGSYHYLALKQSGALTPDIHSISRQRWLRRFIVHSWWICSVISCLLVILYQTHPHLLPLRFGFVLLTIFIYWVSYCALQQPALFFADTTAPAEAFLPKEKKYARSPLKEPEANRILTALQEMTQQRFFTDPALTIEKLSTQLQTNRHVLSQVLNERLNQSFSDYLNSLRVAAAKSLLADPSCKHLKIAAIAYDAGFNSLSVFNDAFKKQTGQTPSDFRKISLVNQA